jgi:exopolysaccharide biosynthesis polyprenyl glycosylphosphotransferase
LLLPTSGPGTGPEGRLEVKVQRTAAAKRRSAMVRWSVLLYVVTDVTLMAAAYVASVSAPPDSDAGGSLGWGAAFCLAVVSLLATRGAYPRHLTVGVLDDLRSVLAAVLLLTMTFISARAVLSGDAAAAGETLRFSSYAAAFLMVGRISLAAVLSRASQRDRVRSPTLILGAGRVGKLMARRLLVDSRLGLDPVGFLDDEPLELPVEPVVLPVLGGPADLDRVVAEHGIEHVIVGFSMASHEVMLSVVRRCWELGVAVSLVPRLYELQGDRAVVARLGGLPLMSVASPRCSGLAISCKYALDRLVAAGILVTIAPLMVAIALAVKISAGGPVLFGQPRVGRDGHHFTMWKFRTMTGTPEGEGQGNAEWVEAVLQGQRTASPRDAAERFGPDRTTALGRWLRRLGLDELPQLWNVLRGEMSLVGPRPEQVSYANRFEPAIYRYRDRQRVKSGITGWAQVNGLRGDTSLEDRVEWDNYYIENWSPWLDVKILLMTIATLWRGKALKIRRVHFPPGSSATRRLSIKGDNRSPRPRPSDR